MNKNKILVIIVAYNSMRWAKRCYESLRASDTPCDIITIDNGSTDGTPDFIRTNYPEVDLREMKANLGFGKANNIGLQRALDDDYEYAYLLNQDAWVLPDTFTAMIAASQAHPEYGLLSPMQMKADMKQFDEKFAVHVIGDHQKTRPLFAEDLYLGRTCEVYEVTFVMAAHWLLTRQCIEAVGGFSPSFFLYGEDDNYLKRVYYWKLKSGFVTTARAVHDRGDANWSPEKENYIKYYTRSLNRCSNPLAKWSVWTVIWKTALDGIKQRNAQIIGFARRLCQERSTIEQNYRASLSRCAFLTSNSTKA